MDLASSCNNFSNFSRLLSDFDLELLNFKCPPGEVDLERDLDFGLDLIFLLCSVSSSLFEQATSKDSLTVGNDLSFLGFLFPAFSSFNFLLASLFSFLSFSSFCFFFFPFLHALFYINLTSLIDFFSLSQLLP